MIVEKIPANNGEMKIDPSIFVSLKKGSISTYYKIGEVLGEGINFLKKNCNLIFFI